MGTGRGREDAHCFLVARQENMWLLGQVSCPAVDQERALSVVPGGGRGGVTASGVSPAISRLQTDLNDVQENSSEHLIAIIIFPAAFG